MEYPFINIVLEWYYLLGSLIWIKQNCSIIHDIIIIIISHLKPYCCVQIVHIR